MKLVVCVKQVGSLGDEVEFTDDERDVDPDYLDYALNEWDSFATEEALRLLEAAGDGEVVAVTVGDEDAEDAMRRALAMGADRGIRIWADELAGADPITVARALAEVVGRRAPTWSSAASSRATRCRRQPGPRSQRSSTCRGSQS